MTDWIADGETGLSVRTKLNTIPNDGTVATGLPVARVSVSSAEILALNSVPKELIAAPGAGKMISIISITAFFTFVLADYADASLVIKYETAGNNLATLDITELAESRVLGLDITPPDGPFSEIANNLVQIQSLAPPTDGDGTLLIDILYRVVDLP